MTNRDAWILFAANAPKFTIEFKEEESNRNVEFTSAVMASWAASYADELCKELAIREKEDRERGA